MTSLAIITPTIGRTRLLETCEDVLNQLGSTDEWWIIGDGPQLGVRTLVRRLNDRRIHYFEHRDSTSRYGNAQRNFAMERSKADYFLFLDDDDVLLPGAIDAIRQESKSGRPLMFKMDYRPLGTVLWHDKVIRVGNVGGAMFVVPNSAGKWARWPALQSSISDFHFIEQTLALWPPDSLQWCEQVIYLCHAQSCGHPVVTSALPCSFDEWRRRRVDGASYSEYVSFYDAIYDHYPNQHYCDVEEASRFAVSLPDKSRVLELGGWTGQVACELLSRCPNIAHWHNVELSTKAVRAGLMHSRYTADVFDDFLWNLSELPEANVLFAAHVIEHLTLAELDRLLTRLSAIDYVFVESPLPPQGLELDWDGSESTNILSIGWNELEERFNRHGFKVTRSEGRVRCFRHERVALHTHTVSHSANSIHADALIHPTANIYGSTIGSGTKVAAFVEIGGAVIGASCKIQAHAFIPPGVTIEDEVFVGPGVIFTNDKYPQATGPWTKIPTLVKRGASIGAGTIVLPGVVIGTKAQIGAGSVVTTDVPDATRAVGNPARAISVTPRPTNARNCLIVLQPREIPRAIESIRSLPVDKVWFRGYTEEQLAPLLNRFISDSHYLNYVLCADDVVVSAEAWTCVEELLKSCQAATGYCCLSADSPLVNVTRRPVELANGTYATWEDYDFYRLDEVQAMPGGFPSWFGGWSLTGMRRHLWLAYPFRVNHYTKHQSDFETALRLGMDGISFRSHRDAYIEHLKQDLNVPCTENWLVGREPPRMVIEYFEDRYVAW